MLAGPFCRQVGKASHSHAMGALLNEVPDELQGDLGYALCRLHWLLLRDEVADAARIRSATPSP
jgi:hypothetical protein